MSLIRCYTNVMTYNRALSLGIQQLNMNWASINWTFCRIMVGMM